MPTLPRPQRMDACYTSNELGEKPTPEPELTKWDILIFKLTIMKSTTIYWTIIAALLILIAAALLSEDNEGCHCDARYSIPGQPGYYTTPNTPTDCNGNPTVSNSNPNSYFVGCVNER